MIFSKLSVMEDRESYRIVTNWRRPRRHNNQMQCSILYWNPEQIKSRFLREESGDIGIKSIV